MYPAGRNFILQFIFFEPFVTKTVSCFGIGVKTVDIDKFVVANLAVHIGIIASHRLFSVTSQISVPEIIESFTGLWHNKKSHQQHNHGNDGSPNQKRSQKPRKRYSGTQYGNDFGIVGQFRCKPNHRQKQKYREQQIHEIDGKMIIVNQNFRNWNLVCYHFIDLFRNIDDDSNRYKQSQHHRKSGQVFFQDVFVYYCKHVKSFVRIDTKLI